MRVEVTAVLDPDRRLIHFESAVGSADAFVHGTAPLVRGVLDVEVDIPDEVESWEVVEGGQSAVVGDENGRVRIVGEVLSFDVEDRIVSLRVGGDVLLVELADRPVENLVGARLSMDVPQIHLYELNL
ncbi:hypothetical protein ACIA5G_40660 [Amycolatopsis sp. NPDC051758]|jgi:hypothetical protein|uniref:hypothetical protein n=1 Tax=Amycolatopsis sp. NPDC051758 TaxID=3363935 RepID=UPI00379E15CF